MSLYEYDSSLTCFLTTYTFAAFCRRSFHLGCMRGKMVLPKADERQWYCADCRAGQHECFLCKQRGTDNLVSFCAFILGRKV